MGFNFTVLIIPVATFLILILTLFLARGLILRFLHKWAAKTAGKLDDLIIDSIKVPSYYLIAAVSLYISIGVSDIPEKLSFYLIKILYVLIILSLTFTIANLAGKTLQHYIEKTAIPIPTTGLTYIIIKGVILVVGVLVIMGTLGISITPLITALGVGGFAVALALQDTLSNLFAGIHILVEKPIRVGDYIKLETGQEGYVDDIGWRTTRIKMLPNNMVIVPNNKLAQSIVINYYLPEKKMSLLIPIGVSYSSDPEMIEKILVEEAKKAAVEIPGLLGESEPFVRFIPGFGDSSLDFTLICQVREFVDQYLAQHELRKRIFKRFKKEGIEVPFPHRTVYLREEKEWKK